MRGSALGPSTGLLVALSILLAGCAPFTPDPGTRSIVTSLTPARVSDAQACAIGYDMARAIHDTVSLRRTVILAPSRTSPCERHTLAYLRKAGFRIDETGGAGLSIALDRAGYDQTGQPIVSAVVEIGSGLRLTRLYRPVATGVFPAGPVTIQHLNPDTYGQTP